MKWNELFKGSLKKKSIQSVARIHSRISDTRQWRKQSRVFNNRVRYYSNILLELPIFRWYVFYNNYFISLFNPIYGFLKLFIKFHVNLHTRNLLWCFLIMCLGKNVRISKLYLKFLFVHLFQKQNRINFIFKILKTLLLHIYKHVCRYKTD